MPLSYIENRSVICDFFVDICFYFSIYICTVSKLMLNIKFKKNGKASESTEKNWVDCFYEG